MSLADLVRETGLPHATARRLVLELAEAGAVERSPDGRFVIGLRLWQLGTLAPRTESLRVLAKPFMDDLYTALRQHVQLAVLDDDAVIVERMSAPHAVGLVSEVGGRLPLHCSGVGKVLLSHADRAFVDRILSGPFPAYTARTNVDPRALRREIAACRRTGTAMVRGELTVGADSVATRIVDRQGQVVAALSVVVRTGSVRPRYLEQLADEHGGWTVLTHLLVRRAGPSVGMPEDPATIERGLRRLKARGDAPGGQYGRWLLRYFGVPRPLEDTARWMGQYHSRFADLPLSLREAQLWLWDRPPIVDSSAACWIHLGLASAALRRRDLDGVRPRLARARHARCGRAGRVGSARGAAGDGRRTGRPRRRGTHAGARADHRVAARR